MSIRPALDPCRQVKIRGRPPRTSLNAFLVQMGRVPCNWTRRPQRSKMDRLLPLRLKTPIRAAPVPMVTYGSNLENLLNTLFLYRSGACERLCA